jgi:hypothetical protein
MAGHVRELYVAMQCGRMQHRRRVVSRTMIAIDLSGFLEEFGVDRGKEEVSKFAVLKIAGAGPCPFASR